MFSACVPSMAAVLLIFIQMFMAMAICVSAQKHKITLGSVLTPSKNPKWISPNGNFAFGFYPINPTVYVVGIWFENIPAKTLVWTAMSNNKRDLPVEEGSTLQLSDSGLKLYDSQRNLQWSAAPSENVVAAAMLDTGNFVLLNPSLRAMWQSFDYPTNTLLPGQTLKWKSSLYCKASTTNNSAGRFELAMQGDGNLVLYTRDRRGTSEGAYWATDTYKSVDNPTRLNFEPSGVLYLVNSTNITVATLTQGNAAGSGQFLRRVTLDINGILGQYVWTINRNSQTSTWSSVWRSGENPCKDVKGQCGSNGVCRLTSENTPDCFCPPQFDFIDSKDHFKGCVPKLSQGLSCTASSTSTSTMSQLQNTGWMSDSGYSVLVDLGESECLQSCMDDCMCIVVTYADKICSKKQMPLLDGREGTDVTYKTYVKISDAFEVQRPFPPLPRHHQTKGRERKGKVLVIIGISLLACSSILLAASFVMICFRGYGQKVRTIGEQNNVVAGHK